MNGRIENEKRVEEKIYSTIKNKPFYIERYYDTILSLSYTTRYNYIHYVLNFIEHIQEKYKIEIDDVENFKNIKPSMISAYIMKMDCGTSLKRARLYGIKSFFEYLQNDGYIDSNPCDRVKAPAIKKEYNIIALNKDDIQILKENILNGVGNDIAKGRQKKYVNRDLAIIMMGLSLGLRVTSLSEINLEDINFNKNKIQITEKGNKTRYIDFSKELKKVILNWVEDRKVIAEKYNVETNALFISRQHERISSQGISKLVKKYTYNIDKHITPHKLRSTCATNICKVTGDIAVAAEVLGHSNIQTTRRYVQIDERKEKTSSASNGQNLILKLYS